MCHNTGSDKYKWKKISKYVKISQGGIEPPNQYLLVLLIFTCFFNVYIDTVMYKYSIFLYL
jgi:hypothetical protein